MKMPQPEVIQENNEDTVQNGPVSEADFGAIGAILGEKALNSNNGSYDIYFQQFLNTFPVAVYTCDNKGYIKYFNYAAVELFGRVPQSGKDLYSGYWHAFDMAGKPLTENEYPMAIAMKECRSVFGKQLIIERPDGTRRTIMPYPQPILDEHQKIVGGINVVIDITAQKQTELNLKGIEIRYDQLIQALPAAIYTCDAQGHILIYNKAAADLWGREPEIGKDLWCGSWKIYLPNGTPLPLDQCPMAIALKEGRAIENEEIIVERPDGLKRNIMPHPKPFFDSSGNVVGAVNMLVDITDRKIIEERNGHFAAIVQYSDDAIISKTLEGIITSWNNAAERMFGYTAEEMIGTHITRLIPPDRIHEEPVILERLKRGDRIDHFETKRITKDHKILDVSLTISPVKDSRGRIIGASKIARDITAQKKAEQRIRESEERLRQATQGADLGTFTWDMGNGQFNFSDRLVHIYGYTHTARLTNDILMDAIYAEDRINADKAWERALKTGILNYEVRIVLPNINQTIRWIRVNAKLTFDELNNPVKMQGIVMNVTEQKESEQKIRESEERLRLAAEAAELGMWDLDLKTGVTITSPEHRKIIGYSKNEAWNNDRYMEHIHSEDRDMVQLAFKQALKTGRMVYEARILRPDKSERWIRVNSTTIYDKKQAPVRMLGTILDITEQKKAKEDLEKKVLERTKELVLTNEQLEKSNHELEQFAYIASHDLQEPLRKIQTFADLVKDHLHDHAMTERYFTKINSSARRMSMLINDVLNYSRLTKNGEQFISTDLNKILKDVLSDFELLIEQKEAVITNNELPVIKGIPLQLNQLFSNLISNSLKFSENKPVIEINSKMLTPEEIERKYPRLKRDAGYVELMFKDNGIGFEQQYAEQIFIIFQRLNNQKAYTGTGIGLALCKKIVEYHDGIIIANSEKGQGSTFTVVLPVNH
jgi:PAS domain S-box-containing protein